MRQMWQMDILSTGARFCAGCAMRGPFRLRGLRHAKAARKGNIGRLRQLRHARMRQKSKTDLPSLYSDKPGQFISPHARTWRNWRSGLQEGGCRDRGEPLEANHALGADRVYPMVNCL